MAALRHLFLLLSLLAFGPYPGHAEPSLPSEQLHYRLAYRGLLTSFIWKRLADVTFSTAPGALEFQGMDSCRHTFTLTTEKYAFAELLQPVRYRWQGTVSRDLQTLYLIEEIDEGRDNKHDVYWFDWANAAVERYRRREKEREQHNLFDPTPAEEHWEKDGKKPLPAFLQHYPLLKGGLEPLIHKRSYRQPESRKVIDPLTMIYALRRHDFSKGPKLMNVAADDEALPFRAVLKGREMIRQNGEEVRALKVKVVPESEEYRDKGYIDLWLRDDATRIPLRFIIDAPLGHMRVELKSAQSPRRMRDEERPVCVADQPENSRNVRTDEDSPR